MALTAGDDMVESFCVRLNGKANKADVVEGVSYWPLHQDSNTDDLFYKELRGISRSGVLVLMGDFSFSDVS